MRQIKRITRAPKSLFEQLQQGVIRFSRVPEDRLHEIERSHPGWIVKDGEALVIAAPAAGSIDLHYSFPSADVFRQRFPLMFQRLSRAVMTGDAPFGYRFRLTERSSRPFVEPVLTSLAFEQSREWMLMELVELPGAPALSEDIAPGFHLRPAKPEDIPDIIALEESAFPNPQITPETIARGMTDYTFYRVLEEAATKRIVGSLLGEIRDAKTGHIHILAIHPDMQRRSLGAAMTQWALGQFAQLGARRATLTTNVDNAPAIALYKKLGFAPKEFGLDYRRPIDEEEVRQVLERKRAEHVSMRPRWSIR
jgi:mycothiol synthase